jgi:hypothetical protein
MGSIKKNTCFDHRKVPWKQKSVNILHPTNILLVQGELLSVYLVFPPPVTKIISDEKFWALYEIQV